MSDAIKHECGIALIRLRKPLAYYHEKYGSPTYGMNKLYLLMEKQHNRGQDGAGVANIKLDTKPGKRYISRYRSVDQKPIGDIFNKIGKKYAKAKRLGGDKFFDTEWRKENCGFSGEVWLGHLRYGTHGGLNVENCQPMLRQNNWRSRNLVLAGNFNMTNVDELFDILVNIGQHPKKKIDTVTVMEKIGHFLDEENQMIFDKYKSRYPNQEITNIIEKEIDIQRILERSCKDFDGGYAIAGLIGHGAAFVARDPAGIRPAYYYEDDEVVVVASEKPAIKTAFDIDYDAIREIKPGHALIIDKDATLTEKQYIEPLVKKSCSFERIYFSRGSDPGIYKERKQLGKLLVPRILESINYDLKNTVFSFIPNTAETSFLGMIEGLEEFLIQQRKDIILNGKSNSDTLEDLLSFRPRVEKIVIKDANLRTFITDELHRNDMVAHVYDTTYEVIKKSVDTLVVIDDSIVRGTTLEKSILKMLDKLGPKKIIIVSSAPQIRYPDCYGIDMSRMKDFVVFRALLKLLKESGKENLLDDIYDKCMSAGDEKFEQNYVKELYDMFDYETLSAKVAEIVTPEEMNAEVEVLFQTVEGLHQACPDHLGDWYFAGDYPTPGGYKVVNRAFANFMEGKTVRAY